MANIIKRKNLPKDRQSPPDLIDEAPRSLRPPERPGYMTMHGVCHCWKKILLAQKSDFHFRGFSGLMLNRRVFTICHGNYRVLTVDSGTRFLLEFRLTPVTMQFRLDAPGLGTCWSETPFPARSVAALRRLSVLTHYTHLAAGQRSHSLGVCFSVLKIEVQLIIDVKLCEKCSIKSSRRSII